MFYTFYFSLKKYQNLQNILIESLNTNNSFIFINDRL